MVNFTAASVTFLLAAGITAADLITGILRRPVFRAFFLFFLSHPLLLLLWAGKLVDSSSAMSSAARFVITASIGCFLIYYFTRLNLFPFQTKESVSVRAKLLMGGRSLLSWGLYTVFAQAVFIKLHLSQKALPDLAPEWMAIDWLLTVILLIFMLANGFFRIFILSSRLRIVRRIFIMSTIWLPLFNLITVQYMRRIALDEFDHEVNKTYARHTRKEKEVCQTKYPLLMLHGVGFRDLKYLNYWGRIPRELTRNGAQIYYGNQEAWGTVKDNSEDVRKRILEVLKETGAEKVNIIAHSKGGLDARCAILHPDIKGKVATLTTMSTPHRGCPMANITYRLPEGFYRFTAKVIDWYFRKIGDENPDFYTACQQFSTIYAERFNQEYENDPDVYYQSYMSLMKGPFSDLLLFIPCLIMSVVAGKSDGLVTVESAQWGNFRGVFQNTHLRGISHGDMVDLKRQDYRGFDVVETYIGIVNELKNMGY